MRKSIKCISAFLGICCAGHALAQETMREALDNRPAPGAAKLENQASTFKVGNLNALLTPSFEMDYNDNINLSPKDAQQDFILKPVASLLGIYPVTARNTLSFYAGVGYSYYIQHPEFSSLYLASGSGVNFDVAAGDFLINFHDGFSYAQDAAAQSAVAGDGRFGTAANTVGLLASWDLGDLSPSLGYDHQNVMSTSDSFQAQNHSSEVLLARGGLRVYPEVVTGIEGSGSFTAYDQRVLNNNNSYTAGAYADWVSGPVSIQAQGGYSIFQFDTTSARIQTASFNSWYASLTAAYAFSKAVSASLNGGHQIRLGIESDAIETWYAMPAVNWSLIEGGNLSFGLSYENGEQGVGNRLGNLSETYDYYSANFGFSYTITKRLSASLNYRLTLRSSNAADRGYTQNLVGLQLVYPFQ